MQLRSTAVPLKELARVILVGKQSYLFLIATILSFAFSISVILSTIGLMDGFEHTLLDGLRKSSGDLKLLTRNGFFGSEKEVELVTAHSNISESTHIYQSEGFFMNNTLSRGVVIKGIEEESFNKVTGLKIQVAPGEMAVGSELAKQMRLKEGQSAVIAFSNGNRGLKSLPLLKRLKITKIVNHGIYEKDLRFIYIPIEDLRSYLNTTNGFNLVFLRLKNRTMPQVEKTLQEIREKIQNPLILKPSWDEFSSFLDAVEIEKISITIVLQLIVIVSIFNIAAFIIFISERKSQDFFLFRALGMNAKGILKFWASMVVFIWSCSCLISYLLTIVFDKLVLKLPFLQIPGQIYVLGSLSLSLESKDYLIVFSLSLFWVILVTSIGILKLKKKSILYGLRKEFS